MREVKKPVELFLTYSNEVEEPTMDDLMKPSIKEDPVLTMTNQISKYNRLLSCYDVS